MLAAALAVTAAVQGAVWLDVPFVRQPKNGCGSAAVSMVMEYWSRRGATIPDGAAQPQRIQKALYSRRESGIWAQDLVRYLETNGFRAFAFKAEWEDLDAHVSKGRPLIVCLGHSPLHYVVVAGVDRERALLYINDPAGRKLMKLDRASFERVWQDHWALLAVPRETH